MAKTAAEKTVAKKAAPAKGITKPAAGKTVVKKQAPAKATAKVTAKAVTKVAKAAAKPVAKAVAKTVAKKVVKTVAKATLKPTAKAAAKPVTKAATKPAAKAVVKVAAKPVAKPAAKLPAKATPKSAVQKPATKPVAKLATKLATKAPAKVPAKPAAKAAAKVITQKPVPAAPKRVETPRNKPTAPAAPKRAATRIIPLDGSVLTEAQLLKMSDKDYMNAEQLGFFKARLTAMKSEILDNARETGEHLKENETFADPNDRATVEEENMLEQRVRDRERKLLKKIDQSLARIEEGEYGYCLETGEPIGLPRLLARPTAELSIEAQEKHERLEKLFAD